MYTLHLPAIYFLILSCSLNTLLDRQKDMQDNLIVLQWNCRSLYQNRHELLNYLANHNIDILCLQSLGRDQSDLPHIKGFCFPPLYRRNENKKIAVATYISTKLVFQPIVSPCPSFAHMSVAVEIETDTGPLTIVNNYYPQGVPQVEDSEWISKLDPKESWLVLGDYNASHPDWGSEICQTRRGGNHLAQHIIDSPLCLLNDGSFTRFPDRDGDSPSSIDISLISSKFLSLTDWYTLNNDLGSDHVPIIITINCTISSQPIDNRQKYNFEKADWNQFASLLSQESPTDKSQAPSEQLDELRCKILKNADRSIPKLRNLDRQKVSNPGWNEDCNIAVLEKHRVHNRYRRHRNNPELRASLGAELKIAKAKMRRAISQANDTYWFNQINDNVKDHFDLGSFHKKIRNIKTNRSPQVTMLEHNGKRTETLQEKVDLQAEIFANASSTRTLPHDMQTTRQTLDSTPNPPLFDDSPLNDRFLLHELKRAISQIKKVKKSSGSDPVCYYMIKHLPDNTLSDLLEIYNLFWDAGQVPDQWKEAEVIAIHKPGKPRKDPKAYRPISLTPHLSKIYERMILNRLQYQLDKKGFIHSSQAGFRHGRGTSDHLVKLSSHVRKAFMKRKPTLCVSFDVKGAFDQVWTNKLMSKLRFCGISGKMYHSIKSFMSNRSLRVREMGAVSHLKFVDMGVPQGSILAPTLFSVMLHDLTPSLMKHSHLATYADDIIIWYSLKSNSLKSPNSKRIVLDNFQQDINTITNFMKSNGFQLSEEKTTFIIFKPKYSRNKYFNNISIQIENTDIKPSEYLKYLGVTFDSRFNFDKHTDISISKVRKLFFFFKELEGTPALNVIHHKLKLARAFVRSRLLYGLETFYAMKNSNVDKLKIIECHFLRKILHLANGTPQAQVYRLAKWLPIDQEIRLRCSQYIIRCQQVENYTSDEILQNYTSNTINESPVKKQLSDKDKRQLYSIYDFSEPLFDVAKIEQTDVRKPCQPWQVPPWKLEHAVIDSDYATCSKKDNPNLIAIEAKMKIDQLHQHTLKIFTDGSKIENRVGCAWTIPSLQITKNYRLTDNSSITTAELMAILEALRFICNCPRTFISITILTDSKSALQSITRENGTRTELVREIMILIHEIRIRGTEVSLIWIPSHVGIHGNDEADISAKQSTNFPTLTHDIKLAKSEINPILKRTAHNINNTNYKILAQERQWTVHEIRENHQIPKWTDMKRLGLYNRLCTGYLHQFYKKELCFCGQTIATPNHLINCNDIFPQRCPLRLRAQKEKINWTIDALLTGPSSIQTGLAYEITKQISFSEYGWKY